MSKSFQFWAEHGYYPGERPVELEHKPGTFVFVKKGEIEETAHKFENVVSVQGFASHCFDFEHGCVKTHYLEHKVLVERSIDPGWTDSVIFSIRNASEGDVD